ncbi:hypothetical protein SLS63_013207 [Diaporthe eres]|uniref:Uncharacterized protein n=1 Tax=Diaporthe eres TaxID=83184 RepID=A0ABR1NP53_DIAER
MHREEERHPGRREPSFPGLHNLHKSVFERTLRPPEPCEEEHKRRKMLWDLGAHAVREALEDLPAGSHINICANSGPYDPKFEDLPPWATVPGASVGLLMVAEFRDEEATGIHPGWRQVAHPIRADEGRLLAGLRLLATVTGRRDLTFTVTNITHATVPLRWMNFVREHELLSYGSVTDSWKPTNLGCWFHHGCLFQSEYEVFRDSFAWDGDLYGWDEAVLYTRGPVAVVDDVRPERRFDSWSPDAVLVGVTWLQVVDGELFGGYKEETTRADVITWDTKGIPGGPYFQKL